MGVASVVTLLGHLSMLQRMCTHPSGYKVEAILLQGYCVQAEEGDTAWRGKITMLIILPSILESI